MGRLLITILLSAIGISANAKGDWWIEAEDASSSVTTQDDLYYDYFNRAEMVSWKNGFFFRSHCNSKWIVWIFYGAFFCILQNIGNTIPVFIFSHASLYIFPKGDICFFVG